MLELAEYAENKNEEVEIYVDHLVSSAQVIELVEGVNGGGVNEEDSNAGVNDIGANEEAGVGANEKASAVVNVGVIHEEEVGVVVDDVWANEEEVIAVVNGDVINEEEPNVAVNGGVVNEEEGNMDVNDGEVNEQEANLVVNDGDVNEEEANVGAGSGVVSGDDEPDELDESEDERHRDDDDCFRLEDTLRRNFSQVLDRWKKFKQDWKNRKRSRTTGMGTAEGNQSEGLGTSSTQQSTDNHEIDANYSTDELDSDVDIAYEDGGRKYPIFKGEDMCKEFKFKLGMEFSSLKQFKQALMEHSVLNGREVKFFKNDDVRVRAICKRKCEFLVLCSKVGGSQTFRVKTLIDTHNYGRFFVNNNANKKWVSKIVVDKFRNVGRMTANEIIDDVRRSYSVAITPWRACRAKEITMDILEGDGQKQYNLLYDYVVELRRVSIETTVKIKINQPQPTL